MVTKNIAEIRAASILCEVKKFPETDCSEHLDVPDTLDVAADVRLQQYFCLIELSGGR
jgi:hypothetical protein